MLDNEREKFLRQKKNIWNECFNRYNEISERDAQFKQSMNIFHKSEFERVKSSMNDMMKTFRIQIDKDKEHFRSKIQKQKANLFFQAIVAVKEKEEMKRQIDKNLRIIAMKKRQLTKIQSDIIAEKEHIECGKVANKKNIDKMMIKIAQMNTSVNKWNENIKTDTLLNVNKVI